MQTQRDVATLDSADLWSDEQVFSALILTALPETQDEARAHTVQMVEVAPYLTLDREEAA